MRFLIVLRPMTNDPYLRDEREVSQDSSWNASNG
jgi:hypothetical protein